MAKHWWLGLACALAVVESQSSTCGLPCTSDVQCPDTRGVCTYCTRRVCSPASPSSCGAPPAPNKTALPQLLVVGDSISIGYAPQLAAALSGVFEAQHDPVNAGNAAKGAQCASSWVGNGSDGSAHPQPWDLVTFNFGLHSLDFPATAETESLANYTAHVRAAAVAVRARARRVLWIDTTPVPLRVTSGPGRRNRDVLAYNAAAGALMAELGIASCSAYGAVAAVCPDTSGAPDHTYESCPLQTPGGVHFPGHYDVIVAALATCITGHAPPPTPPPEPPAGQCADAEAAAVGAGGGAACSAYYQGHKPELAPCVLPYTAAGVAHPQEDFVQCWCFNKTASCQLPVTSPM